MLEFFEVIYQLRLGDIVKSNNREVNDERMFFVPSLLSGFNHNDSSGHPAVQYWQRIEAK